MSEFDKEAEREKLREKFAKDEEKRQSTKRMSELLLKGATMTNRHCNACGDPLFRFDDQEFCPSCQDAEVAGGQIRLRNPSGRQEAADQSSQPAESAQAAESASTQTADGSATQTADEATTGQRDQRAPATAQARDGDDAAVEPTQPPVPATDAVEETPQSTPSSPRSEEMNLDAARAALRRTVTRYAEEAERADDPRRAHELLTAAHEAAETLAALRR